MKEPQHPEAAAARAWRESRGLTVAQLSELTGYAVETHYWMERGCTPPNRNSKGGHARDRAIKSYVWQRYRNVCAGVDRVLQAGREWNWK